MILSELIPLKLNKILQTQAYTLVLLGTEEKQFGIYTEPTLGQALQMHFAGIEKERPETYTLLNLILSSLKLKVQHVLINDIQETTYFARLFLVKEEKGLKYITEIDARPSDCLMLALINKAPIYCTLQLLEKIIPIKEQDLLF